LAGFTDNGPFLKKVDHYKERPIKERPIKERPTKERDENKRA
jgi:hypothetical protein